MAGCFGDSDEADYITTSSAQFRAHGQCNNTQQDATHGNCFFYWQVRKKGKTWLPPDPGSNCPTASAPAVVNGVDNAMMWGLSCTWGSLVASTKYEFQICGNDVGKSAVCGNLRSFTTKTFSNPVDRIIFGGSQDLPVGDPRANYFDATYYLTGSGWGEGATSTPTEIYSSPDLLLWQMLGKPTFTNAKSDGSGRPTWASNANDSRNTNPPVNIAWWGTELHKVKVGTAGDSRYVLVSSFDHDVGGQTQASIGLATATSVLGPYTWLPNPVDVPSPTEQHIDPSLFVDDSGQTWLLHNVNGGAIASVLLDATTLARVSSSENFLLRNDVDPKSYEIWEGSGHGLQEGPGMIKAPDGSYILYYATGTTDYTADDQYGYTLGLARGSNLTSMFTKMPDSRIINNTATWKGAGHGGIVPDIAGRLWYVYHSTRAIGGLRLTMVQEIFWDPLTHWYFFEGNSIRDADIGIPTK